MKKWITLCLAAVLLVMSLGACTVAESPKEIHVLTLSADHRWTGAALEQAKEMAKELESQGGYTVTVQEAESAKTQQEQLAALLTAKKQPDGIVLLPFDNSLEEAALKLAESGIPFVMYDRIIENEAVQKAAVSVVRGDNIGIGSGIAKQFLESDLTSKDKIYVMVGDNSSVSVMRTKGFQDTLTESGWTAEDLASLDFSPVTDWSRAESKAIFTQWIQGKTEAELAEYHYVFVHDDEIAMGLLEALADTEISPEKKDVFSRSVRAIGASSGLEELYQVLRGTHDNTAYPDIVKDLDLFSLSYSPATIRLAIGDMVDSLQGKSVVKDHLLPYELVNGKNVSDYTGF